MGQSALQFVYDYQAQIWSLATVIFSTLIGRIFRLKPKLRYSVHHSSNLLVDEPRFDDKGNQVAARQIVKTVSIVIENSGLQAAKGVEVAFNRKPPILNISPARSFTDVRSSFDRYSLKFDSFAPGEQSTVEIMSINADLPMMTAVRCDDCVGEMIPMAPQRVWPQWFLNVIGVITILGAATVVYMLIRFVQFVSDMR